MRVTCYVLRVTCYVLRVTCYVLRCYSYIVGQVAVDAALNRKLMGVKFTRMQNAAFVYDFE